MSRNCSETRRRAVNSGGGSDELAAAGGGFMLFGVRVLTEEGSFRKSVSLNNLSQYELASEEQQNLDHVHAPGYVSDDVVHNSAPNRERKRGVPWTEEEHKRFLLGLQKVGKGDWRGISRNFVKTRTPTQVASHAQKYFLRRNNLNRRRRRSSLFDITTDTVALATENHLQVQEEASSSKIVRPKPVLPVPPPTASRMTDLSLNNAESMINDPSSLTLKLSSSSGITSSSDLSRQSSRHSAFKIMSSSFSSGDSSGNMISVA
ncbi:hypothetical protein MKW94_018762 [Papaver nudicaule]|uniref:Uncharacterized protein n=1 Tax=Papaver nudicaule TaxID=74823 RepID=A0AA41VPD6_PAPNU|nr:hypothetical protein [Papaver nudicaule]